jgi:EAL domain-containing protein (putative c-di-GMP-specific phosphodiesterase class I)
MYHAKDNGRGNFQFFRDEMNARMLRRVSLERSLRHALDNNEFILHYQPRYSLPEGKIVGMEALVRWNHPEEGLVPPAEFIPLAEESNLIILLGEWVLHTACAQIQTWKQQGLGSYRMAVNLSSRQFQQLDLVQQIQAALQHCQLDPELLELEITESVVMHNPEEVASLLAAIRRLGVHISIDDFGTGYSSLAYLKKFPINALKIDRSFVSDLPHDQDDVAIVESIIGMTRSLGIDVVAEGVETREQLEFLQSRGCGEVQGYYFSKPLPPEEMTKLLRNPAATTADSNE